MYGDVFSLILRGITPYVQLAAIKQDMKQTLSTEFQVFAAHAIHPFIHIFDFTLKIIITKPLDGTNDDTDLFIKKVQLGNDQERAQSERTSHSKNRSMKTLN